MLVYCIGLAIVAVVAVAVAAPLLWPAAPVAVMPGGDPERHRLEKEKDLAYAAIKEAEFDFQMGKLSPEDYALLRQKYEARALAALAALERRG
jgi:hypothetical protein